MDAKSVGLENMEKNQVNFNGNPWNLSSRSFCKSTKTFCCIFLCCFAPIMAIAVDFTWFQEQTGCWRQDWALHCSENGKAMGLKCTISTVACLNTWIIEKVLFVSLKKNRFFVYVFYSYIHTCALGFRCNNWFWWCKLNYLQTSVLFLSKH